MNYAKGIHAARQRMGISKRKLASLAGFDASYITHLEAGRKKPSLDAVEAISKALAVPVYLLMLWSAEDDDLLGVSGTQAAALSGMLTDLLRAVEIDGGTSNGAATP